MGGQLAISPVVLQVVDMLVGEPIEYLCSTSFGSRSGRGEDVPDIQADATSCVGEESTCPNGVAPVDALHVDQRDRLDSGSCDTRILRTERQQRTSPSEIEEGV